MRDQQRAADPIQRIVFAASMAERGLLHPSAAVVDRLVREPDGVEVIDHDRRVIEPIGQAVGVAAERINDRNLDPGEPLPMAGVEPVPHDPPGPAGGDVQQHVTVEVREAGDHLAATFRVGAQETRLVQPKCRWVAEPGRIIDQHQPDRDDRGHCCIPPDPVVPGDC